MIVLNIAVIFAGGVGSRMKSKSGVPKQFLEVAGKTIIAHTIQIFEDNKNIDQIVVSMLPSGIDKMSKIVAQHGFKKVSAIVPGGETGQLSIFNGLKAARSISNSNNDIVLIHDGVRPLITSDLINQNIEGVKKYGSAITTAPAKETFVLVDESGGVEEVVDRRKSFIAKAPQSFFLDEILMIDEKAIADGEIDVIDSSTLMAQHGVKLHIVEGPYENIKITTPDDYFMFKALYEAPLTN